MYSFLVKKTPDNKTSLVRIETIARTRDYRGNLSPTCYRDDNNTPQAGQRIAKQCHSLHAVVGLMNLSVYRACREPPRVSKFQRVQELYYADSGVLN